MLTPLQACLFFLERELFHYYYFFWGDNPPLDHYQFSGIVLMSTIIQSEVVSGSPVSEAPVKQVLRSGRRKEFNVYVPSTKLTIKQIRDLIPDNYFERSLVTSFLYLARDLLQVATVYLIMHWAGVPLLNTLEASAATWNLHPYVTTAVVWLSKLFVWNAFWFIQGLNGTALWVLAHECGHQAFSPFRSVNDTIGLILHSATLVPYHSWRITHGNHHKHTNHLTKDTVFVPRKENKVIELVEETPLWLLWDMIRMFVFGWPAYLMFNVASQKYGRRANHFEPYCPLFRPEEARDVVVSDIGILATLLIIGACTYHYGISAVACWYVAPYLWVNFWLVYITYLQHSDVRIPHYSHDHWTFVRGAVAAVDRDYGALLNTWLHHINDSHVVHHLFSQMPFYNAISVTRKHIREILGETYINDHRSMCASLLQTMTECRYVVPSEGVCVFYGPNVHRYPAHTSGG